MNELHRPLGQKPRRKPKRFSPALPLAVAGLLIGLAIIGLMAWDRLDPPLQTARQAPTVPPRAVESIGQPSPNRNDAANEQETGAGKNEAENAGAGLRELEPDGAIAAPEPLPPAAPQPKGLAHLPDPELIERHANGPLPKRSADGRRPMHVYAREPDTSGNFGVARVVLIIGGLGLSQTSTQEAIRRLPPTVTLAFAPYGNSLGRWMQAARKAGHELLLQIPMEPFGYPQTSPGPNTLVGGVSDKENLKSLYWAMGRITNYVGVMNYQGAKLLADPGSLKPIFDELSKRGLLFVDDGSASGTQSVETANASLLPYTRAHIQLDTIRTRREIAKKLNRLAEEARRTGLGIGVGNAFSITIDMVDEFAKKAAERGIEITPVSAVVDDPERR